MKYRLLNFRHELKLKKTEESEEENLIRFILATSYRIVAGENSDYKY